MIFFLCPRPRRPGDDGAAHLMRVNLCKCADLGLANGNLYRLLQPVWAVAYHFGGRNGCPGGAPSEREGCSISQF